MTGDAPRERPIIFSGPEVVSILDGRKTQTRRVITTPIWHVDSELDDDGWPVFEDPDMPSTWLRLPCPHGAVGNRLWVRETWQDWCPIWDGHWCGCGSQEMREKTHRPAYRATIDERGEPLRWRPSIHMPRWASRITLEISEVRVQRLQEISEDDAATEGATRDTEQNIRKWGYDQTMRMAFADLWDSINGKRPNASWDSNPLIWAITFRRLKP